MHFTTQGESSKYLFFLNNFYNFCFVNSSETLFSHHSHTPSSDNNFKRKIKLL